MPAIAHISDLHFGRHDPAAVEALAADIAAVMPEVLVNSGDFTQRSRRRQWDLADRFMQRLPASRICVPGNHDIPLFNLALRFLSPLRNFRSHVTADPFPTLLTPAVALVGVNTARPLIFNPTGFWKDGAFSDAQLTTIESRLASADPSALRVVVAHHPLVPPRLEKPRHHIVWRVREALRAFSRAGVDVVLSGHLHLAYSDDAMSHHLNTPRSILCIQAGTAVSSRRRSNHGNSYNLIAVHSRTHLTLQVRTFCDGVFRATAEEQWHRCHDNWTRTGEAEPH